MLEWVVRKVTRSPAFFEQLPDVLADWVRYAGRRRGVPFHLLRDAVAAVAEYRREMLEAVNDPAAWGLGKVFTSAALEAGVDLTDRNQVKAFIRRYNEDLAA